VQFRLKFFCKFSEDDVLPIIKINDTIKMEVKRMKTKLTHVRVNVCDIHKAVEWYETVLGFECNGIDINERWAYADFNHETGAVFALTVDKNVPSYGRFNFDVDDVDLLWKRLKDKVEIIQNIETMPYGTRKFTIKDLDGNELGFVQQKIKEE
jgi:predicted enzyme related to lactoylglutathione lyase